MVLAASLALAPPAQAQAGVWSATLTPGKIGGVNSVLGFEGASGTLSDERFRYAGQHYEIESLYLDQQTSNRRLLLRVGRVGNLAQGFNAAAVSDLTLIVGSDTFDLSDATLSSSDTRAQWTRRGIALSAGTDVSVSLVIKNVPRPTDATVSTDGRSIVLTFSEDLDHPTLYSSAARNAFTVTVDGDANGVVQMGGTDDTVTLQMEYRIGAGQAVVISYDRSDAGSQALEDSDDQEVGDFTTGSGGVPAVDNKSTLDTTPPALTAATVSTNGNAVTLTFDENVVAAAGVLPAALADAFTVTVDGVERQVTGIVSFARTQVALQVGTVHQGQTVTVSYDISVVGANALLDDANNDVASFTTGEDGVPAVTNNSTVASAKLVSVTVPAHGTDLTLTFDKALNAVSLGETSGIQNRFAATADGVEVAITGSQGLTSADDNFKLHVRSSAPIYKDEAVVLTYVKPTGSDGLTDEANDLSVVSFTTGQHGVPAVTNNSTVVAPPRLATAEVQAGGNEIYLGFDEGFDVPATVAQALKDAFTVTVDGEERAFADLEFFGVGYTFVKLVFTETLIPAGASVVVSYDQSDAGASALEGENSNKVPDFTTGAGGVVAVTNNSTVSSDATLSGLTVSILDAAGNALAAVALSPSFDSATEAYSVSVAFHRGQVTFMPAASQTGATVDYFDAADMSLEDAGTSSADVDAGHQVDTAVGANTVKVKVTAPDKTTTKTYSVTVTRALPTLHGSGVQTNGTSFLLEFQAQFPSGTGSLPAGAVAAFTVTADGVEREITGIAQGITEAILDITLSTAIYKDQAVVVSYDSAAAGADALEDRDGNAFQSFTSGEGGVAEASNKSTQTFPTPSTPSNFTADPGDKRAILAWTAPAATAPITKHQYRFKTTGEYDDDDWTDIPDSGPGGDNEDGYTVTGLTNGRAHTFQLRAANRDTESTAVESSAVTPADVTAPTLSSAEVRSDGTTLHLEFSELLQGVPLIVPTEIVDAFAVTVDGIEVGIENAVSSRKSLVIVTVSSTIYQGQTVVVSYDKTVAGSNAIEDAADNEVASFITGEDGVPAVRNNSNAVAPPQNFTATAGNAQVTLTWDVPATKLGVTHHDYQFKTDGSYGNWIEIDDSGPGETNEGSFTVPNLTNDTPYTFQLRAADRDEDSAAAAEVEVTPKAGASSDATLRALAVNDGTSDLTLTPAFASGTTDYAASAANDVAQVTVTPTVNHAEADVEYLDGDDNELDDADTNAAGHQVALAVGANTVKVKVTAEDNTATETYTVTVTRAATMTPTCTPDTAAGDIWCGVLTVGALSPGEDGFFGPTGGLSDTTFSVGSNRYEIFQVSVYGPTSTYPGRLVFNLHRTFDAADKARLVLHVDSSSDTFAFSAAMPGTGLNNNWAGTSLDWSSATFVTLRLRLAPAAPGAPTNLMADADGGTRIDLSWDAPADDGGSAITGYRIEVSDDAGSNWSELVDDTGNDGTSYTHEGLSEGDTRHYRVSAINAEGTSEASDVADATTMREDPAADATLRALTVTRSGDVTVPLQPAFAPGTEGYTAWVANAVEEVTVAAEANAAGATLAYLDGDGAAIPDADTGTPGREVALEVGANTVQVKVTATDGDATRTYRVTVTRRAADAPGAEGEWRLTDEKPYADVPNDRYGGTMGRAEVFHAGAWGTVCSDSIERSTFSVFNYDANNQLEMDSDGNPTETEYDNEAAALICQAEGYDDGEYHTRYSKYRPGAAEAEPDPQEADYWPPHSSYPADGPTPIWIDDLRCVAGKPELTGTAALPGKMNHCSYAGWGLHNCTHKEDAVVRCWNGGDLEPPEGGGGTLKGRFVSPPERHDGTKRIKVQVAFSEPVEESPRNVGAHGVEVEGGEVTSVSPVGGDAPGGAGTRSAGGRNAGQQDREVVWEFEIEPDSDGDVTVSIEAGRPCDEPGAICTADGRTLSEGISTTVEGPEEGPPPLTASFTSLPEAHDGESAFRFRLAFSERIAISFRSLREDAFEVTGGRVTRGKRVDGRKDLFEITVEPDGTGEVSLSLPAGRECSVSGAICTWGPPRKQLTNTPAATVAGPAVETGPAPLTASFVDVPAEHDGESAFTFRIAFSERVGWMNGRRLREHVVAVSGGRATSASRVNRRRDLWQVTVEPDSLADVTVALSAGAACRTPAAVCTSDGRALSNSISATVRGPVTVSVADARAEEGADETIDFAVTLSRAASGTVEVAYATADGTATAGADYTRTGGELRFAPGETAKTVSVPVLDDAHDEGEETLTLRLTAATGARIADGVATGTIENADHMPAAWLARFGRTVTDQVLDAVEERLAAPRRPGAQATLAGQALPSWDGDATAAADPGSGSGAGDNAASERALAARDREAMTAIRDWMARSGAGGPGAGDPWGEGPEDRERSRALTGRDFLIGTSFALTGGSAEAGGYAALWGRGAISRFDGREGDLTLDGEVTTGLMGADWASGPGSRRWTAGLAVGHARGTGGYSEGGGCTGGGDTGDGDSSDGDAGDRGASRCAGEVEATLTGLWPYGGLQLTDRLSAWGAAGYGAGEMRLTPGGGSPFTADLTMAMGAAGLRGEVLTPPEEGGLALAVKGDARFTRTASEATRDADGGRLAAATADVWLLRAGIEGSRRFVLAGSGSGTGGGDAGGMVLTPSFELGARLDGGDAETGLGVDLGGGLAFAAPRQGVALDLKGRGLIAHEASGFREWGASAALTWDPRPTTDRGLALRLRQSWGGSPTGGMDALLGRETLAGLAANDNGGTASVGRLEAELGYGIALFDGGFTGTPNLGIGFSETGRDYRVGWRLTSARKGDPGFAIGLDATRREAANADAEHGLMLRGTIRW